MTNFWKTLLLWARLGRLIKAKARYLRLISGMRNTHFENHCDLPLMLEQVVNSRRMFQQQAIVLDSQGYPKISDRFTTLKEMTREIESIMHTWTEEELKETKS